MEMMTTMSKRRRYLVDIPEVHISTREVFASSPEEALKIAGHEGEELSLKYDYSLDTDKWTVEEKDDE